MKREGYPMVSLRAFAVDSVDFIKVSRRAFQRLSRPHCQSSHRAFPAFHKVLFQLCVIKKAVDDPQSREDDRLPQDQTEMASIFPLPLCRRSYFIIIFYSLSPSAGILIFAKREAALNLNKFYDKQNKCRRGDDASVTAVAPSYRKSFLFFSLGHTKFKNPYWKKTTVLWDMYTFRKHETVLQRRIWRYMYPRTSPDL